MTRILGNRLLRSFLLLSLIEWKINIVYHRHWHWPHYHHNNGTHTKNCWPNAQKFLIWTKNCLYLIEWFIFLLPAQAYFVYVLFSFYFFIWPFVYVKAFFYSAWNIPIHQWWNSLYFSVCVSSLRPIELIRWHEMELIFFHTYFSYVRIFFFYLLLVIRGNIFRIHCKLCTTRLNYRLQIAKYKTHTHIYPINFFLLFELVYGKKYCTFTLFNTNHFDCDDIFHLNTFVCDWSFITIDFVHQF